MEECWHSRSVLFVWLFGIYVNINHRYMSIIHVVRCMHANLRIGDEDKSYDMAGQVSQILLMFLLILMFFYVIWNSLLIMNL